LQGGEKLMRAGAGQWHSNLGTGVKGLFCQGRVGGGGGGGGESRKETQARRKRDIQNGFLNTWGTGGPAVGRWMTCYAKATGEKGWRRVEVRIQMRGLADRGCARGTEQGSWGPRRGGRIVGPPSRMAVVVPKSRVAAVEHSRKTKVFPPVFFNAGVVIGGWGIRGGRALQGQGGRCAPR